MLHAWWNNRRSIGSPPPRARAAARQNAARGSGEGVVEPDNRLVFAAMAVGMIVGALLLTPARTPATAILKAPGASTE